MNNELTEFQTQKLAAIDLLKNSDRTVAEIAAACGFESEYYFYSFFKRNTGATPTAIRRQKNILI